MSCTPFFSVIIPTYNRSNYVLEAVESVLNQTFENFEVIVIDDGSSDDTGKYFPHLDQRVSYYKQDNNGVSSARNLGVSKSIGKYICYLDSDDLWHKEKLTCLFDICQEFNDYEVIINDFHKQDVSLPKSYDMSNSQIFPNIFEIFNQLTESVWGGGKEEAFELLLRGFPIYPSAACVKKELHINYRWDPGVLKSEDFNLFLKLSLRYKFLYIDKSLTTVRIHDSNKSLDMVTKNKVILDTIKVFSMLYCGSERREIVEKHLLNHYFLNGIYHLKRMELSIGLSYLLKSLINYKFYKNRFIKIFSLKK